ncbi:MAG: hypothetical protein J3K34DRAFT_461968 [Monoraphidium minutum]|nr:MAG: hypothetical protein J3K34DRAFT_461968 [Monoraphidium minutum]
MASGLMLRLGQVLGTLRAQREAVQQAPAAAAALAAAARPLAPLALHASPPGLAPAAWPAPAAPLAGGWTASAAASRRFSSGGGERAGGAGAAGGPGSAAAVDAGGAYYRTPFHPAAAYEDLDVGQRRAAGRLETAIEGALLADAVVREQLVERLGVVVHRVRLSADRRTAHILWDARPGAAAAAEAALGRCAFRLRRHIAKATRARHTPYLSFVHDHLPPNQAGVAAAIERVEAEALREARREARREGGGGGGGRWRGQEAAAGTGGASDGGGGGGGGEDFYAAAAAAEAGPGAGAAAAAGAPPLPPGDLDDAIRKLEARLPPRRRRRAAAAEGEDEPGEAGRG